MGLHTSIGLGLVRQARTRSSIVKMGEIHPHLHFIFKENETTGMELISKIKKLIFLFGNIVIT